MKKFLAAVALAALTAGAAVPALADGHSGTVTISSTSVAIGVGVTWGSGTLTMLDGTTHEFGVEGVSVVDLGVTSVEATGTVYNLENVEDFSGPYVAVAAGAAAGDSVGVLSMRNGNGVVINLRSQGQGARLTLAPTGAELVLK